MESEVPPAFSCPGTSAHCQAPLPTAARAPVSPRLASLSRHGLQAWPQGHWSFIREARPEKRAVQSYWVGPRGLTTAGASVAGFLLAAPLLSDPLGTAGRQWTGPREEAANLRSSVPLWTHQGKGPCFHFCLGVACASHVAPQTHPLPLSPGSDWARWTPWTQGCPWGTGKCLRQTQWLQFRSEVPRPPLAVLCPQGQGAGSSKDSCPARAWGGGAEGQGATWPVPCACLPAPPPHMVRVVLVSRPWQGEEGWFGGTHPRCLLRMSLQPPGPWADHHQADHHQGPRARSLQSPLCLPAGH